MSRWVDLDDDRHCFIGEHGDYDRYNIATDAIVDIQPDNPIAHWEIHIVSMLDGEECRCSNCGKEGDWIWRFCPSCGRRMVDVI